MATKTYSTIHDTARSAINSDGTLGSQPRSGFHKLSICGRMVTALKLKGNFQGNCSKMFHLLMCMFARIKWSGADTNSAFCFVGEDGSGINDVLKNLPISQDTSMYVRVSSPDVGSERRWCHITQNATIVHWHKTMGDTIPETVRSRLCSGTSSTISDYILQFNHYQHRHTAFITAPHLTVIECLRTDSRFTILKTSADSKNKIDIDAICKLRDLALRTFLLPLSDDQTLDSKNEQAHLIGKLRVYGEKSTDIITTLRTRAFPFLYDKSLAKLGFVYTTKGEILSIIWSWLITTGMWETVDCHRYSDIIAGLGFQRIGRYTVRGKSMRLLVLGVRDNFIPIGFRGGSFAPDKALMEVLRRRDNSHEYTADTQM